MPAAALPLNEEERLLALERYAILDTLPEQQYDDLTYLASQICHTPIALVSIVDQHRQWFKSKVGLDVCETTREMSFCAYALHNPSVLEVPDATVDERFRDNPFVTGSPYLRFYAGAPLITPEGYTLGTLCVADHQVRRLTPEQKRALESLARQAVAQMELWRTIKRLEIASMERQSALQVAQTNAARLRATENRFRRFMDNSPLVAFIKDAQGRYLYINSVLCQTFEVDEASLLGHTDFEWLPRGIAETVSQNDRQVLESGQPTRLIEDVPTPNGQMRHWLSFKFAIQDLENGQVLGGVSLDITEMQQAQQLKNEFVSIVSHELRTPLTSIRGALGLLHNGVAGELPSRAQEMVEIAQKNSERLVLLVGDILDIEKIESGKMRFEMAPVSLDTLLDNAVEASQPYARTLDVYLSLEVLPLDLQNAWVCGDEDRLMQVMANFLSNASKWTPSKGQVKVRARKIRADRVRVEVQDEGEGVPPEFVPRLFERFAQADASSTRQQGGTGLGLAIARALIEKHQGEIGYLPPDTKQGRCGATFYFEMPYFASRELTPCVARRSNVERCSNVESRADVESHVS